MGARAQGRAGDGGGPVGRRSRPVTRATISASAPVPVAVAAAGSHGDDDDAEGPIAAPGTRRPGPRGDPPESVWRGTGRLSVSKSAMPSSCESDGWNQQIRCSEDGHSR